MPRVDDAQREDDALRGIGSVAGASEIPRLLGVRAWPCPPGTPSGPAKPAPLASGCPHAAILDAFGLFSAAQHDNLSNLTTAHEDFRRQ